MEMGSCKMVGYNGDDKWILSRFALPLRKAANGPSVIGNHI